MRDWHKSTYSAAADNCVEVAETASGAAVRDTGNRELGHLDFTRKEWAALLGVLEMKNHSSA